jgi:hypothetical protein
MEPQIRVAPLDFPMELPTGFPMETWDTIASKATVETILKMMQGHKIFNLLIKERARITTIPRNWKMRCACYVYQELNAIYSGYWVYYEIPDKCINLAGKAATIGREDLVEYLLCFVPYSPYPDDYPDSDDDNTILAGAARGGYLDLVKKLSEILRWGHPPDFIYWGTIMCVATRGNHIDVVKFCITQIKARNSDPEEDSWRFGHAYTIAVDRKFSELANLFLQEHEYGVKYDHNYADYNSYFSDRFFDIE